MSSYKWTSININVMKGAIMLFLYTIIQITLRNLIDQMMTLWLWVNKKEKTIRGKKDHENK